MLKVSKKTGEDHIDDLVRVDHPYRKLINAVDFSKLCRPLRGLFHEDKGRKGYHIESGFTALVLHWNCVLATPLYRAFLLCFEKTLS